MSTQFQLRFKTLLQREWMQHHMGWLIAMVALPVLALLIMPFGKIDIHEAVPPTEFAAAALGITVMSVWVVTLLMTGFQLPGLARRDQQDRSIEFWLSLPASHSESLAATLLMHTIFVLLMALGAGLALGVLVSIAATIKFAGLGALLDVAWFSLPLPALAGVARLALGSVLFTLWMAPIFMIFMVAAAWLKRWGVPAVITVVTIGGNVLDKLYQNKIVWELLERQVNGAGRAFLDADRAMDAAGGKAEVSMKSLNDAVSWFGHDALSALSQLASPHFIGGLLIAAACFALLILHRRGAH